MTLLRLAALLLAVGLVQGCAQLGYECPECCPMPTVAQAPAPKPKPRPVADPCAGVIRLRGVNFDFDRAEIRPEARPILDQAAERLSQCPGERVVVEGHTDAIGSDGYNQDLSERRASSVRDYIVGRGVSAGRIQAVGRGESQPIAGNDTPDGRQLNRRVEIRFLD